MSHTVNYKTEKVIVEVVHCAGKVLILSTGISWKEFEMFKRIKRFVLAIAILFCSTAFIFADLSKDEEREINAYRLTKAKITQFGQATKNLLQAFEKNPKLFDTPAAAKQEKTLANMIEVTNSIPAAKKAIEDAGLTARDYWMFQMAMVYAGTGNMVLKSGGQLPEGFSKENVEFYRANEAEFMKLDADIKAIQKRTSESSREDTEEED